jgi:hypothetical protein
VLGVRALTCVDQPSVEVHPHLVGGEDEALIALPRDLRLDPRVRSDPRVIQQLRDGDATSRVHRQHPEGKRKGLNQSGCRVQGHVMTQLTWQ